MWHHSSKWNSWRVPGEFRGAQAGMRGVKAAQQQLHPSTKSPESFLPFPPGLPLCTKAAFRDVAASPVPQSILWSRGRISGGDKNQAGCCEVVLGVLSLCPNRSGRRWCWIRSLSTLMSQPGVSWDGWPFISNSLILIPVHASKD